jgi:CDGSH-type Zn-finger protein
MSKTKRDNRSTEKRFCDGNHKYQETYDQHKKEKRIRNIFRSNNIGDLVSEFDHDDYKIYS